MSLSSPRNRWGRESLRKSYQERVSDGRKPDSECRSQETNLLRRK
jgi:hypothetical protein